MQNIYNRHPYQSENISRKQHHRASDRTVPTCTADELRAAELRIAESRVRREARRQRIGV